MPLLVVKLQHHSIQPISLCVKVVSNRTFNSSEQGEYYLCQEF
jgi:hypothetical protein